MAKLGDWVRDSKNGHVGRVHRKDFTFWETNTPKAWLDLQSVPFTEEDLQKPWYHVLTVGGGAILTSEEYVEVITVIVGELDNAYESFYFGDE